MSLLPGRILPQTEPFGTLSEDGKTVIIDKNWWLLFYNMALQSIGTGTGIPTDQLIDLESVDIDSVGTDAAVLRPSLAALANLIPTETDPVPSLQDVKNALLLAYSALDAADALGFAAPTAKVGLTAIAGAAQTAMRSDAAPPIDVTITVTWSGVHTWLASSGSTTMSAQTPSTATFSIIRCTDQTGARKLEMVYCGSTSGGAYGAAAGSAVINAQGGTLTISMTDQAAMVLTTTGVTVVNRLGINNATPPAQVTGWGVPAAPAVVATFPATPTLGQCGQAIGQIIKDLKAFGLYGA